MELVFCWWKLNIERAFNYVASTEYLGLEYAGVHEKKNPRFVRESKIATRDDLPFYAETSFNNMLNRLEWMHYRYFNMKKALLSGNRAQDHSGLSIASDTFVQQIEKICQNPKSAASDQPYGNVLEVDGVTIGERRKQIIEKSMGVNASSKELTNEDEITSSKGKGKGKRSKAGSSPLRRANSSSSGDLRTLARSLAAVKEDPSLLLALSDESDLVVAKKKLKGGRGRPRKEKTEDSE